MAILATAIAPTDGSTTESVAFTAAWEKGEAPTVVSGAQRGLLESRAVVVRAGDEPVMRVWFRREIPVRATPEEIKKGVTCRQIPEGTLVGAVELPRTFIDYRKQRIAAGVYTLRFAMQPDTGEHTDTAPHREFCLLSPAADDRATGDIPPKALIELSSRVNQGRHPAVLLLWPNEGGNAALRVLDKGQGVQVVAVKRPAIASRRKATVSFGFTAVGFHQQ